MILCVSGVFPSAKLKEKINVVLNGLDYAPRSDFEVKQTIGAYPQGIGNVKYDIERYRAIGSFDAAHVRSADVHELRKLAL